jgi:hypothetical protein
VISTIKTDFLLKLKEANQPRVPRNSILGYKELRSDFVHVKYQFGAHPTGRYYSEDQEVRQGVYINRDIPSVPHQQRHFDENPQKERSVLEEVTGQRSPFLTQRNGIDVYLVEDIGPFPMSRGQRQNVN